MSAPKIKPRPYQVAAANSALNWWRGKRDKPLIEAATGAGKTIICAAIAKHILKTKGTRVMVISHSGEIIRQDATTISKMIPLHEIGTLCASTGSQNYRGCRVLVTSISSAHRKIGQDWMRGFTHVIIDEAHALPPNDQSMYTELMLQLKLANKRIKVMGLSASMGRLEDGHLTGKRGAWEGICFSVRAGQLVNEGWLVPAVIPEIPAECRFDPKGVAVNKKTGEFKMGALVDAIEQQGLLASALDDAIKQADAAGAWPMIVFAPTIDLAQAAAAHINARGRRAASVHGRNLDIINDIALVSIRNGAIDALTAVGKLTTGFDAPAIRSVVMIRPTRSKSLWQQMTGRGARPFPGKSNYLLLDYVGGTKAHGRPEDIVFDGGKDVGAMRACKRCGASSPPSLKTCACRGKLAA